MSKAAIIIDSEMPQGLLANAIACITSGLFLEGKDYVGDEIKGKDVNYIPITKIPILILKPGNTSLLDHLKKAQQSGIKYMAFTKEAQTTTNYEEYTDRVKDKSLSEITIVGLGLVGDDKTISSLTGNLPMLR